MRHAITHAMFLVAMLTAGGAWSQSGERYASAWPNTDFTRHEVPMAQIRSGGPGKDGIPSIDRPVFVDVAAARDWIDPGEPVILLGDVSQPKLYPLQILIWHEIVNDVVDGVPVAVTFCPLCNASIVFDRRVGGRTLEFGTTGLLRNSDLVMYDRQTESWWQQFTGRAIVGEMTGETLSMVPAQIVSFDAAAGRHPDAQVLGRDTGFSRPYGSNPYPGYDRIGQRPFLFDGEVDGRLPAMERVLGVVSGDDVKIYPHEEMAATPVVNDRVGELPVLVVAMDDSRSALDERRMAESRRVLTVRAYDRRVDGQTLSFERDGDHLVDDATGSRWSRFGEAVDGAYRGARLGLIDGGSHFAFAWLAFRPHSEIYRAGR